MVGPFLNQKAKQILARLSADMTSNYQTLKDAILREIKLSAATYLHRFNTCGKKAEETYVAYASRLQGLLNYYPDSKKVEDFKTLCEFLVCDRLKSILSKNCMKYVLSIESSKKGWRPLKELTESVDRFLASRTDTVKPRA